MSTMDKERRTHDDLRQMVDSACEGVMPHIADRIKDAARRAYFLGARDGIEVERTNTSDLVSKTIHNHQELVNAARELKAAETLFLTDVEKQELHVKATLDRCRRCGDFTPSILPTPPLSLLCGDCERIVKATDGGVMWFAELVAAVEKEKAYENNDTDADADTG